VALIAKNENNPCDIVQFTSQGSVWPRVDNWAQRHGYALKKSEGNSRHYQKGRNILLSPMMLDVIQQDAQVSIKAYIQINGYFMKSNLALSAPGFLAKLPRAIGKKAVNELLRELGQQEIS
jgi:hypothetical protein